jgi:hypothetical protein
MRKMGKMEISLPAVVRSGSQVELCGSKFCRRMLLAQSPIFQHVIMPMDSAFDIGDSQFARAHIFTPGWLRGVSGTFPLPTWQAGANVPPSVNPGHFVGRGLPDLAGDVDPGTGYQVDLDGSKIVVGGTSAVAPLWAGLIACFSSGLKTSVGYPNPTLYQRVTSVAGTFRDITSGNNGGYQAGPGWDACTGWGSPNGAAILQSLTAISPSTTPAPDPTRPTKKRKKR